jgi:hypothetical protein
MAAVGCTSTGWSPSDVLTAATTDCAMAQRRAPINTKPPAETGKGSSTLAAYAPVGAFAAAHEDTSGATSGHIHVAALTMISDS